MKQVIKGYAFFRHLQQNPEKLKLYIQYRKIDQDHINHIEENLAAKKQIEHKLNQLKMQRNQHYPIDKPLIQKLSEQYRVLVSKIESLCLELPNYPVIDHPEDKVIFTWGDNTLMKKHNLPVIANDCGVRAAQRNFSYLAGNVARLHRALGQFMLDTHIKRHNYQELYTPYLLNADSFLNTGQLPKFEDKLFAVPEDKLFLIPTGEVSILNYYRDRIFKEQELNINVTALTPCFRREEATYGRLNKGLRRQHQFDKVELIKIVRPQDEDQAFETLVKEACYIVQTLDIPYRIIRIGYDELGFSASKTYDIDIYLGGAQDYMEISSCSTCNTWQSARLNMRYKDYNGNVVVPCTLNGSGVAVGRLLLGFLARYVTDNNQVNIPEVLQPYLQGENKLIIQ